MAPRGHHVWQVLHATCSQLSGLVEADETYIGSATKNKHKYKREHICGGTKGKAVIVGNNDGETNQIDGTSLPDYRGNTIQPFIIDNTIPDAAVYSGLRGMVQPPTCKHD